MIDDVEELRFDELTAEHAELEGASSLEALRSGLRHHYPRLADDACISVVRFHLRSLEARLLCAWPRWRPNSGRYCYGMRELIEPTGRLHGAWLEAHAEWGPGVHEDGFGLLPTDDVESPAGFAAWVERLAGEHERCTYRWIVDGNKVLGGIALRHEKHDLAPGAGHIGYGIRPSVRRRGLATWALGRMVREAQVLGMERLLVVCEAGNSASARTIERQGGILEDDAGNGAVLRYWIRTGESGA